MIDLSLFIVEADESAEAVGLVNQLPPVLKCKIIDKFKLRDNKADLCSSFIMSCLSEFYDVYGMVETSSSTLFNSIVNRRLSYKQ